MLRLLWQALALRLVLRLVLLFVIIRAIDAFQTELFSIHTSLFSADFTGHSLIVLAGGIFILYTAVKEISHMLSIEHIGGDNQEATTRSPGTAIAWIVVMNLVFSFDSILSAVALTDVFAVMATAVVVSGVLMIALADTVSEFLKKNRMYEVLGLFILFIVGVMLVSEGGHLAHIHLLDYVVEPMAKSTFYFTLIVLVFVDIAQSRYQKKLNLERKKGA